MKTAAGRTKAVIPLLLIIALAAVLAAVVGTAASSPGQVNAPPSQQDLRDLDDTGTLTLSADFPVNYPETDCPPGTPSLVECFARAGADLVRGLGNVEESYTYLVDPSPAGCNPYQVRLLPAAVRFHAPGKGELELHVDGTGCVNRGLAPLRAEAAFTITGGSGRFAGASGGGTYVDHSFGPPKYRGRDTWNGTLVVPGLNFDLTPPTLTGAVGKTIRVRRRVKRVRVAYAVTAQDDVDGPIPVTCRPRSRSWFRVGRTRVSCSAADTSANNSKVSFVVAVKRKR